MIVISSVCLVTSINLVSGLKGQRGFTNGRHHAWKSSRLNIAYVWKNEGKSCKSVGFCIHVRDWKCHLSTFSGHVCHLMVSSPKRNSMISEYYQIGENVHGLGHAREPLTPSRPFLSARSPLFPSQSTVWHSPHIFLHILHHNKNGYPISISNCPAL